MSFIPFNCTDSITEDGKRAISSKNKKACQSKANHPPCQVNKFEQELGLGGVSMKIGEGADAEGGPQVNKFEQVLTDTHD